MDLFPTGRVRELVSTADGQLAAQSFDAAIDTYRTALVELSGDGADAACAAIEARLARATALQLEAGNQAAGALGKQRADAAPAQEDAEAGRRDTRPVKAPGFQMLDREPPRFESAEDLIPQPLRGGYLPEPEQLSILDPTPHPEPPDYWRIAAGVVAVCMLAIAVRVVWYYSTRHVNLGSPADRSAALYSQPAPVPPPATPATGPVDDTLYYPDIGVALPVLISKVEPPNTPAPGTAQPAGKVVLLVPIDSTGRPESARARVWRGLDTERNVRAIETVGKWRFRPGTKGGRPVPVLAQLEVHFGTQ